MRLVTTRGVADAPLPARYEAARTALAECVEIDECSTWAKKAAALASYARQSEDKSLEQMAMRIRARAIRRCGELLDQIPAKAHDTRGLRGGGANPQHVTSERARAAAAAGLSPDQTKTALRVAAVPAADFESAVESDDPPTISDLAERGTAKKAKPLIDLQGRDPEEFNRSLLMKSSVCDLASMVATITPEALIRGCLPRHYPELREGAERLMRWLQEVLSVLGRQR